VEEDATTEAVAEDVMIDVEAKDEVTTDVLALEVTLEAEAKEKVAMSLDQDVLEVILNRIVQVQTEQQDVLDRILKQVMQAFLDQDVLDVS
jgi:hypothetical protein